MNDIVNKNESESTKRVVMSESHDSATKLYAIPVLSKSQKEPVEKYCFGSCGLISMGGVIEIDGIGGCWVCTQDDCPHEKGHTDIIGSSGMTGSPVCIRGLEA